VEIKEIMMHLFQMTEIFLATTNQGEIKNMNSNRYKQFGAALALALVLAQNTFAGLATPSGVAKVTLPGGVGRTEFFGMPFARPVERSGIISAVSTTGGNATFTVALDAGQSALPSLSNTDQNVDAWYVLEILDGPAIGFLLACTGNTGNTSITVQGDTGTVSVPAGTKFVLRKEWTLSTLFGAASNANAFGYGTSSTAATVKGKVQVYNSLLGTLATYYVRETGTTSKSYNWALSTSTTSRNHVPLRMGRGIVLVNNTASDLNFIASGEYRTARTRLSVPAGFTTFVANPGPSDVTFDTATIPATSPTRATSTPGVGDQWQMWNPLSRSFTTYKVGGTANALGASMYQSSTRVNPTIPGFKAVAVKPVGTSGNVVVTIAPSL
jgi:hypothetical protein